MSWLISRALMEDYANSRSSLGLVEEYLEESCSGGELCAQLNVNPMPQAYLPPDRMTAFSRPSRFGMTFAPLTESLGAELLTWLLGASLARTSALQEPEKALMVNDPVYGQKWPASSMRYDQDARLWRTAQHSLLGGLDVFLETWPRWGLMRNGECWARQTLAPLTDANESGLWPTPTVCGNYNRKGASATSGDGLATVVRMFPTPTATNTKANHMRGADKGKPREARNYMATPTARDWRSGKASKATMERNSRPLSEQIGGQLNPNWVEWLMGWPPGWTDLKPLAMGKCHCALQRPGDC